MLNGYVQHDLCARLQKRLAQTSRACYTHKRRPKTQGPRPKVKAQERTQDTRQENKAQETRQRTRHTLTLAVVTFVLVLPALDTPIIPWSLCTNRVSSASVVRSARISTSATVCGKARKR